MHQRPLRSRNDSKLANGTQQSTIINAAALQDHLARSITLNLFPRKISLRQAANSNNQKHHIADNTKPRQPSTFRENGKRIGQHELAARSVSSEYRKVWICETCTFENDEQQQYTADDRYRCLACGTCRSQQKRAPLSLAQKRGLVACPPPKLSRDEWERCEKQAADRGDLSQPCSICREPYGVKQQAILSCSHMFHLDCITSFERFLRTNQRVCPLCRKQDYQKRSTSTASSYHRVSCAQRIQALFRGVRVRRHVAILWHSFYAAGKGDPVRRRRFLAQKVGRTTDRIVSVMRQRDDSIDSLLAELDKSIKFSRHVFQQQTVPSHPEIEDDSSSGALCKGDDWPSIHRKACVRDEKECAICINPFSASMQGVLLLSCTHLFHTQCLRAFEDFNIYEIPLCPVCRASYRSRSFNIASTF